MGIVEKKLSEHLNIESPEELMEEGEDFQEISDSNFIEVDNVEDENLENKSLVKKVGKNPLTSQPKYKSALVTQADIDAFNEVQENIGLDTYGKIMLMKISQKALVDHDELQDLLPKVDEGKAARLAEVSATCLQVATDASKALLNFSITKERLEIEKSKLEVKNLTINNIGTTENGEDSLVNGTQKEVLEQIRKMMDSDDGEEEPPPLIDVTK